MVPAGFRLLFLLQNTCIALCILWNWWLAHSSQKCFPQDMCCIYELESAVASNPCPILAFTSPRLWVPCWLHIILSIIPGYGGQMRPGAGTGMTSMWGHVPEVALCPSQSSAECQFANCQLFIYTLILRGECSNSFICFLSSKNSVVWFFFLIISWVFFRHVWNLICALQGIV